MPKTDPETAVVTGASSGIGAAIAMALAECGAKLHLIGRNAEALEKVANRARTLTPEVVTYRADLELDSDLDGLKSALAQRCDGVNLLVHSAGIIATGPVATAPVEEFDRQYRTNVRAPYVLTQALLPALRALRGSIVFINSSVGLTTRANISQYAATKHALKAVADSVRAEVNSDGIRVLSVYPGRTASPQQVAIHRAEGKPYAPEKLLQPADVARIILDALKLNRTAEVTDINIRPLQKT
jgi:short-subunit dehydrogenase